MHTHTKNHTTNKKHKHTKRKSINIQKHRRYKQTHKDIHKIMHKHKHKLIHKNKTSYKNIAH